MLKTFWARYRAIVPQHELWADMDNGLKPPERCVPIFVHGDEGVTYKKNAVLVLSIQGCIGTGSNHSTVDEEHGPRMPLNFKRAGLHTRLLSVVCPKDFGEKHMKTSFAVCYKNIFNQTLTSEI